MPAVITPEDEEGIQRLRDYFVENFAEKEAGGKYDSRDIERVKTDDLFIKAFYIHKINLDAKTSADRVTTINRNRNFLDRFLEQKSASVQDVATTNKRLQRALEETLTRNMELEQRLAAACSQHSNNLDAT